MSTLDLSELMPVDVSNFLRVISLLLDQVTDDDGNVPESLDEYFGLALLNVNVRSHPVTSFPFQLTAPFKSTPCFVYDANLLFANPPLESNIDKAPRLDTPKKMASKKRKKAKSVSSVSEEESAHDSDASIVRFVPPVFRLLLFAVHSSESSVPELTEKRATSPAKKKIKTDDEKKGVIKVEKKKVSDSRLPSARSPPISFPFYFIRRVPPLAVVVNFVRLRNPGTLTLRKSPKRGRRAER
jgi:hypothetical protein